MKILISAFSNLYTDQRIEKVCQTLHENGHQITLIGNDWGGTREFTRPYPFEIISLKNKILKFAYLEFNFKLYQKLKKHADKNTLLLANDLDALLPNYMISKSLKIPLLYDSHEIFTEMPSVQGRWSQKFWRFLEKKIMPSIQYMMTESESYAHWFDKKYNILPIVIRNIPRKITTPIHIQENNPKIILYQGAINYSRGLPQAIKSMHYIENAILKIAGNGPKLEEYKKLAETEGLLNQKVFFLGKMIPIELRKLTQTADVGFSLEENNGVSYYYSLPNKVADYIQSKVPIVMINFPEMMKVYQNFKIGEIIDNHEPKNIAEKIKIVLNNGRNFYLNELNQAREILCWENEEEKILNLIKKIEKENFSKNII